MKRSKIFGLALALASGWAISASAGSETIHCNESKTFNAGTDMCGGTAWLECGGSNPILKTRFTQCRWLEVKFNGRVLYHEDIGLKPNFILEYGNLYYGKFTNTGGPSGDKLLVDTTGYSSQPPPPPPPPPGEDPSGPPPPPPPNSGYSFAKTVDVYANNGSSVVPVCGGKVWITSSYQEAAIHFSNVGQCQYFQAVDGAGSGQVTELDGANYNYYKDIPIMTNPAGRYFVLRTLEGGRGVNIHVHFN